MSTRRPVVDVDPDIDPRRVLECAQLARQRALQRLVRRFLSQILSGCTSAACTTPTCLSCSKRLVSRPFRPPTQLTARALAFHLATQHDADRHLCPHRLNVDPDTLEIEGAHGVHICDDDDNDAHDAHDAHDPACPVHPPAVAHALEQRHQSRKDPKSLGQNLYDTVAVILAYSKHVPDPSSILPVLASTRSQEPQAVNGPGPHDPVPTSGGKRYHRSRQTTPAASNGADNTSHHMNERHVSQSVAPQSSGHLRSSGSNALKATPEIFSNGYPLHQIRHVQPLKSSDVFLYETFDGACDDAGADTLRTSTQRPHPMHNMPAAGMTDILAGENETISARGALHKDAATMPLVPHLTCRIMDQLKGEVHHHPSERDQSKYLDFVVDYDCNRRFRPTKPFVNRSLYYTLSDSETLLKSFRDHLGEDYRDWNQKNGALVFDSLCEALEALFRPPPELRGPKSPRLKASRKAMAPSQPNAAEEAPGRYLSHIEVAHLVMICIHALTSSVPIGWPHTWVQVRNLRGWGVVVPGSPPKTTVGDDFVHPWLDIIDQLEYDPAIRLTTRLLQAIGTRRCHEHMLATMHTSGEDRTSTEPSAGVERLLPIMLGHLTQVEKASLERKGKSRSLNNVDEDPGWTVTATFLEWLRTIIVKKWDGNVNINKWGSVGTAITIMTYLHANMDALNLRPYMFLIPHFNEEIDCIQAPLDFLKYKERPNSFHILQHAMFFSEHALVGYFRAINFKRMFKQVQKSARITNFQSRWEQIISNPRHWNIAMHHLEVPLAEYLVLDVTRQSPLEETLDQLWGQEKRKLLKPLKVRIGILEGEVGLDQGGVTYEFFRLILTEAFQPENGMFTIDTQNSMTWLQPASLEPLWKFEMVGVLISLAVYNGITLPVTFPIALYDYFLSQEHNGEHMAAVDFIADGWPTLAKSFRELLAYPGDVADVFMRDYTFSFPAFGQNIDVDMQAFRDRTWPEPAFGTQSPPLKPGKQTRPSLHDASWRRPRDVQTDPPTVTNADREQYVNEYVEWLTFRSVEQQLEAFTRGFHTCLHRRSLSFFTPATLRSLVEGSSFISISLFRKQSVRYELPYHATHPMILDFWAVVEEYDAGEMKRLLEFVTANERIPITGYDSVKFEIIRVGGDTESLPTSSTCFGKLWLPEYRDREKLRQKLGVAIRNSEGFGIV